MFEKLKKEKQDTPVTFEPVTGKVCGSCGHVRKSTDTNPDWQCPACEVAYDKATPKEKTYTRAELKKLNKKYLKRKQAQDYEKSSKELNQNAAKVGLVAGVMTILSGLGSSCSAAAANPAAQVMGTVIAVSSLVYLLAQFIGD